MTARAELSWLVRLDKPGRFLAPLPAGRAGHGVYDGPDRGRRPFAIASPRQVADALSAGRGRDRHHRRGAGAAEA
jgi:hypothetical protein